MANIKVNLTEPLVNGMDIKFKAPCDCSAVSGMVVYYPLDDGSGTGSQTFTFKDAHGNTLTGLGDLFSEGVLVKVMVDTDTGAAYILNADTNGYLEGQKAQGFLTVTGSGTTVSTAYKTCYYVRVGAVLIAHLEFMCDPASNQTGSVDFNLTGLPYMGLFGISVPFVFYYETDDGQYSFSNGYLKINGSKHTLTFDFLESGTTWVKTTIVLGEYVE